MSVREGAQIPDFTAPATGEEFRLAAHRGKKLVIYFYPRDNTPGCTTEAGDFRDRHQAFADAGALIIGVSRDSLRSHDGFRTKHELPFTLIADTDEAVCTMFDVIKTKSMYGKKVRGIERSTFVVDEAGTLSKAWRGVRVPGHVDEVLAHVRQI